MTDFPCGHVWLVGAGPGDPELLTRKAERLIRQASVIFYDALVGPDILDLVPSHVRMISVGKRSGRHSKDQRTIDGLIVEAALAHEIAHLAVQPRVVEEYAGVWKSNGGQGRGEIELDAVDIAVANVGGGVDEAVRFEFRRAR